MIRLAPQQPLGPVEGHAQPYELHRDPDLERLGRVPLVRTSCLWGCSTVKLTIICSMGAIRTADQPAGTNWVNGYPHTAWMDMNLYYIQAFKSGAYPAVTVSDIRVYEAFALTRSQSDVIYFWARPHPAGATASSDGLGRPTGYDWATVRFPSSIPSSIAHCRSRTPCGLSSSPPARPPSPSAAAARRTQPPLARESRSC